mgnify:CR=1 FL=1
MRVKICGITKADQGKAIAELGGHALGFVCVTRSPRYVIPETIVAISQYLPPQVDRIGVFANQGMEEICHIVAVTQLTGVQLHGDESPEFCQALRQQLPGTEMIKAFRVQSGETLEQIHHYTNVIDTLLLDAYHPQQLGGTGKTLNWQSLQGFTPPCPWLLAGGLTPDNVQIALSQVHPDGIDLSSGVEISPGDKDLTKVSRLFQQLAEIN